MKLIARVALAGAVGYLAISNLAFRFRHPWMTDAEVLIHAPEALTWRRVAYDDARPRTAP